MAEKDLSTEERIEEIIEVVLENVYCSHDTTEDGVGAVYKDVNFYPSNEDELKAKIRKLIERKVGREEAKRIFNEIDEVHYYKDRLRFFIKKLKELGIEVED